MGKKFKKILIEGAGLIGPIYAMLLKDYADHIVVIEKRTFDDCCRTFGRSVNLAVSNKGWNTFEILGHTSEVKNLIVRNN